MQCKLPVHATELLQSLDVGVFKSVKSNWGCILFGRLKFTCLQLSKIKFSQLIASDEDVWNRGLVKGNIISGFCKSRIFPPNRTEFPESHFIP